jgi:phospholipid/cholesterol/gamma-HCH transport system ATP-binding protein
MGMQSAPARRDEARAKPEPSGGGPIIQAEGLEVSFGGAPMLTGLSFSVEPGQILAILGESGSGKTTLLRVLLGLLPASRGSLRVAGTDLAGATEEAKAVVVRNLGVAFQTGALFGSLTLAENVMVPIRAHTRLPESTARLLAAIKLATVGLAGAADLFPSQISGGMRKRAGIARAMALDPKILVLDEPSSGLDPLSSAELDRLILTLNRSLGVTVVMVTHNLASVFAVAQRCLLIDASVRGILAAGSPAELRTEHPNPRVRAFFQSNAEETRWRPRPTSSKSGSS